jgi:hypothetical protein
MSDAITKPPKNTLYETDLYAWAQEQARLLRARRWGDLDLDNLIDEVESVGGSEKREIRNRVVKLLAHLLKWKYQPGRRGSSWRKTILDQRQQLADIVESSPSLREYLRRQIRERYLGATLEAADQTGIAIGLFPQESPFTPEQVLDLEFFPEDRSIE